MERPRYDEDEVAEILRRAAELHQQGARSAHSHEGMTLDEIEAAAEEAGLSRALVRRAATEVARVEPRKTETKRWIGGPLETVVERTVTGEHPLDALDRLVEVIRARDHEGGHVSIIGRTLTWTGPRTQDGATTMLTVTVTIRDGQTRISVVGNHRPLVGGIFGGIGGGVGGGAGWMAFVGGAALAGPVGAAVLGVGFLGGVFGVCRAVYGRATRRQRERLTGLADALEHAVMAELSGDASG